MAAGESLDVTQALRTIRRASELLGGGEEPRDSEKAGRIEALEARELSCASTATPSTSMLSNVLSEEIAQLQGPSASPPPYVWPGTNSAADGANREAPPSPGYNGGLLLPPCGTDFSSECLHEGGINRGPQAAGPPPVPWRETGMYAKLRQWVRKDTEDRESLNAALDEIIGLDPASQPVQVSLGTNGPFAEDLAQDLLLPPCVEEISCLRQDVGQRATQLLDDGRDISPIRRRPILERP